MSQNNEIELCEECGGVLQISYTITLRASRPESMSVTPYFAAPLRLCPGHSHQNREKKNPDEYTSLKMAEQVYGQVNEAIRIMGLLGTSDPTPLWQQKENLKYFLTNALRISHDLMSQLENDTIKRP